MSSTLILRISFLLALAATLGSLYFSDVLGYPPCVLCWYQRICMYPLVLVFGAALWSNDRADGGSDGENPLKYSLPLSLIGLAIAIYHNLLYYELIPDSITPCKQGVSCTSKQVEILGFLTIPLMSLITFVAINALSLIQLKYIKHLRKREQTK